MSFVGEIKRRKVFQVAAVYAVVAWMLVQIVATIEAPLSLPYWFDTAIIVLLAVGFPITLVMSWAFDLTPEGMVRTQGPSDGVARPSRRLEYVLVGLLIVCLGWIGFRELGPARGLSANALPNSVAVLPFENLSPNPDDAYFAAGIHEQILNELAKIRDLSVIARTSVLQYEGARRPITEIANELRVQTVMEGSVRYSGDQVRVTAQLIDGSTGFHIWTEDYTGDLADIFGIQSDIAERIALALEVELLPSEQARIERLPTRSPPAYALYLSALETGDISQLDRAIALDPEFALAYAQRAHILGSAFVVFQVAQAGENASEVAANLQRTIIENAEQALILDPNLGLAHAALGEMHMRAWRREEAEAALESAFNLSPNDPEVLASYSQFSSFTGQHEDALRLARRAAELNPGGASGAIVSANLLAGNYQAAAALLRELIDENPADASRYYQLAEVEVFAGNHDEALRYAQLAEQIGTFGTLWSGSGGLTARQAQVYSRVGRPDDATRLFDAMWALSPSPVQAALGYLAIRDTDESLRLFREAADSDVPLPGNAVTIYTKQNVWNDPILDQPEFVEVRSRLGFRE
jgi:TolB-like protein/cytochrome c-type biogenesis protein CcmH/NrfG